jgi:outer membrane protein TolC
MTLALAFVLAARGEIHARSGRPAARPAPVVAERVAAADATDTLRLSDAIALARDANPRLRAARLGATAAGARVSRAGALPDPQLSLSLENRPLAGFGTEDPMTMNVVQLTQMLPWPGKLGFGEASAAHLAQAKLLEADEVARALDADVSAAYYELAYIDRAVAVMRRTRDLLREFLDVSTTMYSVGAGLQQDVLQAQVAVARMSEEITVMEQERVATAARFNALLGRDAGIEVPALELPAPGGAPPSLEALIAMAERQRPALQAARQRVLAAEAGYREARRELYPDFMLSVEYGQRPQYEDMVTIMLGVSLPLFAGSRQLPMRDEMRAMQAMEEAEERDLYNETYARLAELRAQAERARNLSALYASAVLPQARAAVESALSAYRVGRVDYMTLVNNEMTVNRYEIESVRLAAEYRQAVAGIEALIGVQMEGAR